MKPDFYRPQWFARLCVILTIAVASAAEPVKPANYDEVKGMLDRYARNVCATPSSAAEREALLAKGSEAQEALMRLFEDFPDPQYRGAIADALRYGTGDKRAAADFMANQLGPDPAEWPEMDWVRETVAFLAEADHPRARDVARDAVTVKETVTMSFALTALSQIGTKEDIPLLQSVIDERKAQGIDFATDGLQQTAQQAIAAISSGTPRERKANQKLLLDAEKRSKGVGIAVVLGVIAAVLAVVMGLRSRKRERAGMSL